LAKKNWRGLIYPKVQERKGEGGDLLSATQRYSKVALRREIRGAFDQRGGIGTSSPDMISQIVEKKGQRVGQYSKKKNMSGLRIATLEKSKKDKEMEFKRREKMGKE